MLATQALAQDKGVLRANGQYQADAQQQAIDIGMDYQRYRADAGTLTCSTLQWSVHRMIMGSVTDKWTKHEAYSIS
jgi:hypothetical protein